MTKGLIIAPQENHDPERQRILLMHAQKMTARLRKQKGVIGVTLSNSVAEGPVSAASDLDLHVIVSVQFKGNLPEWAFHRKGIIENLHTVHEAELKHAWRVRRDSDALADWFHKTMFGEFLHRFVPLWWDPNTKWKERLPALVSLRQNPEVSQQVALYYAKAADRYLDQASQAYKDDAVYDSHQCLRLAFRAALNAALVHRGWTLRGSKKNIEIAQAFLPDPLVESVLVAGFDIVGLTAITPHHSRKVCQSRLAFRQTYLRELHRLQAHLSGDSYTVHKLEAAIRDYGRHNTGAFDYYTPLLDQNMYLGPINHIRCFSGLIYLPQQLLSCLRRDTHWPIRDFLGLDILSPAVRREWLDLMALTDSRQQCLGLATALMKSLTGLVAEIGKSIEQ